MSTIAQNDNDLSHADARQALEEVTSAMQNTEGLLDQARTVASDAAQRDEQKQITDDEIEVLRDRARRQRKRGQQSLKRRHDGISSVLQQITLNERVIGSAFERFFPTIEDGIYVIQKRGELFLTAQNYETVMQQITDKIAKLESDVKASLAAMESQTESARSNALGWIEPSYTQASAVHEVQIRTPLALRVLKVFRAQDQVISGLQTLHWNGEMEVTKIEDEEHRHKKDVSDIARLVARTLRAMRNKVAGAQKDVQEPAMQASAPANDGVVEAA